MFEPKLRRHQDIIAFKDESDPEGNYIAFHGSNLEVANVSPEVFNEMADISLKTGEIPALQETKNREAKEQLNDWNHEINPDVRKGPISFGIRSLTINVTQICNLHCAYCAAGGDGTYGEPLVRISIEKTFPQIKMLMDKIPDGKNFYVTYVGGEPLLYPEGIAALCQYITEEAQIRNIQPQFGLVTNGTLVTDKVLDLLKKFPIHITISLDGDKEINDQVRPTKDKRSSTEQTLEGVKALHSIRSFIPTMGVSAVHSVPEQNLLETYRFFKTLDMDWYEFNFSYTAKSNSLQHQYLTQMKAMADEAWNTGGEKELRKIKGFDHYFHFLDKQQQIENHCGAGKSFLMMDARNQLYTCPWVVGDKNEIVGKGDQLDSVKLTEYQKPLIVLNNCQLCWARYLCGGGCMYIHSVHTGNKHVKDTLFCERTRGLILMALLYYKRARST